jgi:predicted transposase/invertase (TIGR01784 family)
MGRRKAGRKGGTSQHDRGYKRLFSHSITVEELLRGFLREDWAEGLDFATLERVGNSFISDDLRERHSDLIWRLRFQGEERWFYLYVLLEFQSTPYHFMAVRMLSYVSLLFEEIIRKEKLKAGDLLPAVLPIVVYNGKRPWRAPTGLGSLYVPVPPGLRSWLPDLSYVLLDEGRLDLKKPELMANRVATLFQIETCEDPREIVNLVKRLDDLVPEERDPELRRTFTIWVNSVLRRTSPSGTMISLIGLEDAAMFEENMRAWARKTRQEGRQEGRREGEIEGMRKLLLYSMTQRFGRLPMRVRKQVEEISSTRELRRLTQRVLVAASLEDMSLH